MKLKILIGILVAVLLGVAIYDYTSKQDSLLTAARDGKTITTEELLKSSKRGIEDRDPKGRTPLMLSAVSGNAKITKMLVDAGADLNAKDNAGLNAMQTAIRFLRSDVISVLLDAKMDPNTKLSGGRTCLMVAAQKGDVKLVKKLLEAKADINAKLANGTTAMTYALEASNPEMLALFIELGADVKGDEAVLARIAASGQNKVIKMIFDKGLFKQGVNGGVSQALGYVAATNDLELMDTILNSAQVNVNEVDNNGDTPFLIAVKGGAKIETLSKLLSIKADVNASNKAGSNALMIAVNNPNPEVVKFLIKSGIKIDVANSEGKTPLMVLASCRCPNSAEVVKILIDAKVNVNAQDTDGWTALMYAARDSNFEVAETLIKNGANQSIKAKDGRNAKTIAEQRKQDNIVALFNSGK